MQHDVPALSILVPTRDRAQHVMRLLEGLAAQTLEPSRFEVIVIDDGSSQPLEVDAKAYPFPLAVLRQDRAGFAAARNLGIERCRAQVVLLLAEDALPAHDLCANHLAAHERAPMRTAVLGSFPFSDRARRSPFTRLLDETDLWCSTSELRPNELHDWRFFRTDNLSLPVDALRRMNGFDARMFPEGSVEGLELGYRLFLDGWRLYFAPDCVAHQDRVLTPGEYLDRAAQRGHDLSRAADRHQNPILCGCEDQDTLDALRATALDRVEQHRGALAKLELAFASLEERYAGEALPTETREQAARLVEQVAGAAFAAGIHKAETGIDPLRFEALSRAGLTSVVVVSCDQLAATQRCLEHLRAARDASFPTEVLVVDNGSTDGSAEWLAQQSDLTLIRNDANLGAPHARNQATAIARGDWVAYLDNDVYVPAGWLQRALYHGTVDPRVGAVALVANRASKFQQVAYDRGDTSEDIEAFAAERYAAFERVGQNADLFTSLGVLVRRAVIDTIGGFDETFSPWGFEDDDLALRVRFAGWRNRVALDTFVFHAPYPDEAKHARHSAHLDTNWARFAAKWGPGGTTPARFDYAALGLDLSRSMDPEQLHVPLPEADRRRNVLVLGSGRSGTSLVAGTLAGAGWFVGDEPYPGREANPKGFFETAEINGVNEALLAAAFPQARPAGAMQRWLCALDGTVPAEAPTDLGARIERLGERGPFAFKDPRFCYTLPAWTARLGDVARVCVFRDPAVTAESILREVRNAGYLRGVEMTFEQALEVWRAMYTRVLEQRAEGDWLFVHADQLLTEDGLARLERFVGAPVDRDFPEAGLQRTRCTRTVPAEITELYHDLCDLAGHTVTDTKAPAMQNAQPELTVLICSYQRKDTLARCLRSFEQQTAAGRYEILVVNDGSTDGTRELLDGWNHQPFTRVVHRENGGLAAARNTGLEHARGRYVLLVNDDTIADPDLVEQHLAVHARERGEVAVLGSFEQPEQVLDNALMRVLEDDTLVFCFSMLTPGARHDWCAFWTCNVSAPTDLVRQVGCFDETFRHYGCEDTDLAIRLHQVGVEVVYEPAARAEHDHVIGFEELARRNVMVARAHVRLFRKHPMALEHPTWRNRQELTLAGLEDAHQRALAERPILEASIRTLSQIDLGALERTGPEGAALAKSCEDNLRTQLKVLNQLWWIEGHVEGLKEFGLTDFLSLVNGTAPMLETVSTSAPLPPSIAPSEETAMEEAVASDPTPADSDGPWPLATEAEQRLIAWPRYGDEGDLDRLLATWAECLAGCDSTCLCLRHDPTFDGPLDDAVAALQAAWARTVSDQLELEVLFVDGAMTPADVMRLGGSVEAVLEVPGCDDPARAAFARLVGRPVLDSPMTV